MSKIDICISIIQTIKDYLFSTEKLKKHHEKKHFSRKRKLSLFQVILFLIYSSKASMNINISRIRDELPIVFPNVSKQAVSKARQHIKPSLFKDFFDISVSIFYSKLPSRKTWNSYHIFAVDGSKLELPNSKSNFEHFGKMFTTVYKKVYTMALASMIYDVLEDYIVHASIDEYLASERAAAREHLASLKKLNIHKNSIVIFDRGYYSKDFFRFCSAAGFLCLIRLQEGFNFAKSCTGDNTFTLFGDQKQNILDIPIRIIRVTLDNGTEEYLATNITDTKITQSMFKELYFLRWPVETKYKELKISLLIEEFTGATKVSIIQEFFITMLLSNISSLIKKEADEKIADTADESNKYEYQANRNFIIGAIVINLPKILCNVFEVSKINSIYIEAIRCKSQIQPNRSFPRRKNKMRCQKHYGKKKTTR